MVGLVFWCLASHACMPESPWTRHRTPYRPCRASLVCLCVSLTYCKALCPPSLMRYRRAVGLLLIFLSKKCRGCVSVSHVFSCMWLLFESTFLSFCLGSDLFCFFVGFFATGYPWLTWVSGSSWKTWTTGIFPSLFQTLSTSRENELTLLALYFVNRSSGMQFSAPV